MNYQTIFVLIFISTFLLMKAIAFIVNSSSNSITFKTFFSSPLYAPSSLRRNKKKEKNIVRHTSLRFMSISALFILSLEFYTWLFSTSNWPNYGKAYVLSLFVYLSTSYLAVLGQALSLLTKEVPSDMHNHPYLSKSISEFWSIRWNTWIRDWLHLLSKKIAPNSINLRTVAAFVLSGIFHEVMFNLPYYIFTGESYFGTMMCYFSIQFFCIYFDKKILFSKKLLLRRSFMWMSIILPIPLFVNKPFLYFFNF